MRKQVTTQSIWTNPLALPLAVLLSGLLVGGTVVLSLDSYNGRQAREVNACREMCGPGRASTMSISAGGIKCHCLDYGLKGLVDKKPDRDKSDIPQ